MLKSDTWRIFLSVLFLFLVAALLGGVTFAEAEEFNDSSVSTYGYAAMYNNGSYGLPTYCDHDGNCLYSENFSHAVRPNPFFVYKADEGVTAATIISVLTLVVALAAVWVAGYQLRMQRYQYRKNSHQHSLYEALSHLDESDEARKNFAFLLSDLSQPHQFSGFRPTVCNIIPLIGQIFNRKENISDSKNRHKEFVQVISKTLCGHDNWQDADFADIHLETAVLDDANLSGANFSQAYLIGASMKRANLSNIILYRAELFELTAQWANFCNACLQEASLQQANLQGADFSGANFNDADLINSNLTQAKLNYAYFNGARLRHARLHYVLAFGADFSEVRAEKANFRNSDLSNASFHQANLRHSDFTKATMRSVNLSGADLTGADFSYADLSGVNLENAIMDGAVFFESKINDNTNLGAIRSIKNFSNNGLLTMTMYHSNGLEKPYIFTGYEQTDEEKKPQVTAIDSWKHLFEDN